MIIIKDSAGWRRVTLPCGLNESTALQLLNAISYEAYALPESAEDVMLREPEVSLTQLCHNEYIHGELYLDDCMEWVSCDERSSMLIFGGCIIMTSRSVERDDDAGTFKDIVRWFGGQQFTVTNKDITI